MISQIKGLGKPQAPCEFAANKTSVDGPVTVILTFPDDETMSNWIFDSDETGDFQSFCDRALARLINCLIFVSPSGVEGMHLTCINRSNNRRLPRRKFVYDPF